MMPHRFKVPTFLPDQDVVWVGDDSHAAPAAQARLSAEEVCRRLGVTAWALRHYELLGLIEPARTGGARSYGRQDCDRLALFAKEPRIAAAVSETGRLAPGETPAPSGATLALAREVCEREIERLERQQAEIAAALADLQRIRAVLASRTGQAAT